MTTEPEEQHAPLYDHRLPPITPDALIAFYETRDPTAREATCADTGSCILAHYSYEAVFPRAQHIVVLPCTNLSVIEQAEPTAAYTSIEVINSAGRTLAERRLTQQENLIAVTFDGMAGVGNDDQPTNAEIVAMLKALPNE